MDGERNAVTIMGYGGRMCGKHYFPLISFGIKYSYTIKPAQAHASKVFGRLFFGTRRGCNFNGKSFGIKYSFINKPDQIHLSKVFAPLFAARAAGVTTLEKTLYEIKPYNETCTNPCE